MAYILSKTKKMTNDAIKTTPTATTAAMIAIFELPLSSFGEPAFGFCCETIPVVFVWTEDDEGSTLSKDLDGVIGDLEGTTGDFFGNVLGVVNKADVDPGNGVAGFVVVVVVVGVVLVVGGSSHT